MTTARGRFDVAYGSRLVAILWLAASGCGRGGRADAPAADTPVPSTVFEVIEAERSGLDFANALAPDSARNIFNYMYFYNGAGVGAGDFDGDGLYDLFFAGNQVADRVYRNAGGLRFKDVTAEAGLPDSTDAWSTGVSVADIDGDGRVDVYVSTVAEPSWPGRGGARVYLNRSEAGAIRFVEAARDVGLDTAGYGTQVAWLDYDRDGDLDAYVLRHSVHKNGTFGPRARRLRERHPAAGDLFYRNEGGRFVEVSREVGLSGSSLGYGLGVVSDDFNGDGWPDVYVTNDFHENDYLYLNDTGGGFEEVLQRSTGHTSRFSMGVDAADLNGDARPDLLTLDMLPADLAILRASAAEDPYDVWRMKLRAGYSRQYSRNSLQLSRGGDPDSNALPLFAEVAAQAGLHATDWSWSVLLEDFDLDGNRDVFVTNGILGRSNDLDYIKYVSGDDVQHRLRDSVVSAEELALAERMPVVRLRNRFFRALRPDGLSFRPEVVGEPGFSHGCVAVDLDNDGDRDVVTSDVNGRTQLLRNVTADQPDRRVVALELVGAGDNREAIGAVASLTLADAVGATRELTARVRRVRGFLSSSDPRLVFAVPMGMAPRSLTVAWPAGGIEVFDPVEEWAGAYATVTEGLGRRPDPQAPPPADPLRDGRCGGARAGVRSRGERLR